MTSLKGTKIELDGNLELPLAQMVTFRIARLNAKLNAQATRILRKNGDISLMQWRILVFVHTNPKATHSMISSQTNMDGGQISRCVKSMISTGLLASKTHESDTRKSYLRITKKGLSIYISARPAMRERQMSLINALKPNQTEALFSALRTLEQHVGLLGCTE